MQRLVDARGGKGRGVLALHPAHGEDAEGDAGAVARQPIDARKGAEGHAHPLRAGGVELCHGDGGRLPRQQVELPRIRLDAEDVPLPVPLDAHQGIVIDGVPFQRFGEGLIERRLDGGAHRRPAHRAQDARRPRCHAEEGRQQRRQDDGGDGELLFAGGGRLPIALVAVARLFIHTLCHAIGYARADVFRTDMKILQKYYNISPTDPCRPATKSL